MDTNDTINKMYEFFQSYYPNEVEKMKAGLLKTLEVDYQLLAEFDPFLAEMTLEEPDHVLSAGEIALTSISSGESVYVDMLGNQPIVTQVTQVTHISKVTQPLLFPAFIQNQSQKVLWLLLVVKEATSKEIENFLSIDKSRLSMIFSRSDRQVGLVTQSWVTMRVTDMGNQYSISDQGISFLQRLSDNFSQRYVPKKNDGEVRLLHLYFFNLPESNKISIFDFRVEHLNKLVCVEAIIRNKTAVLPRAAWCRYECPSCGDVLKLFQDDIHYREPSRCSCGRKGHFRLLNTEFKNTLKLTIEDPQSNINLGKEVQRLRGIIYDDLCQRPGLKVSNKILFVGIPREQQREERGVKSVDFDIYLEVNNFKNLNDTEVVISSEDEQQIISYSLEKGLGVLDDLSKRFSPNIIGNYHIKKTLLLQQASKDLPGFKYRQRINAYLFGRPGVGKTDLAMSSFKICFKSAYIEAAKASTVGLTAAAVRDEFLKQWVLEAGALVLAGNGLAVIDECDKLKDEAAANDLGEPMEKGTITIHKANIHDTLQANAKVLGIGNTDENINGSFIDSKALHLRHHLIDRFDLLLKAEEIDDEVLAKKILLSGQEESDDDVDFIKKYLFYSFNHEIINIISSEVYNHLLKFIQTVSVESKLKGFRISPRFIQSLQRLTFASAKLRLADSAELFDAKVAVDLMKRSFEDRGIFFAEQVDFNG